MQRRLPIPPRPARLLPVLLGLFAAVTQAADTAALVPADVDAVQSLDEILVTGDRTLAAARAAIVEAEDRFYARWNALNRDRHFDIRCWNETPRDHPSRFTRRVCQPAFIAEVDGDASRRAVASMQGVAGEDSTVVIPSTGPTQMLLREEMRKRTLAMLAKDPELKRALLERARLEQHYEALRKEKFKDRWIVWK